MNDIEQRRKAFTGALAPASDEGECHVFICTGPVTCPPPQPSHPPSFPIHPSPAGVGGDPGIQRVWGAANSLLQGTLEYEKHGPPPEH
eukprot:2565219-Rhodomonas_salina.1